VLLGFFTNRRQLFPVILRPQNATICEGLRKPLAVLGGTMIQRRLALTVVLCCTVVGFTGAQVSTPKTGRDQYDAILFEKAQQALSKSNFAEARTLLNALIDNHANSDYVPRAKLSIADSWYSEHSFKQAETEYRDFITFFPGRPEVAYARRRINSINRNTTRQQRGESDSCYSVMRVYHMQRVDPESDETRLAGVSECQTSPIAVSYP
jgi:outer membrane assembly lipoprotein YfiO